MKLRLWVVVAACAVKAVCAEVVPGTWSSEFYACTNLAVRANMPMLLVYGTEGCSYCYQLEQAMADGAFADWMAERKYVFCKYHVEGTATQEQADAFYFINDIRNPSGNPRCCLYWPQSDGTLVAVTFKGRNRQMPIREGSLAEQLMASADFYFGAWETGSAFAVSGTEFDRYEAEPTTQYVDVELVRSSGGVQTEGLEVWWPNAAAAAAVYSVSWGVEEMSKTVRVSLACGLPFPADGAAITLKRTNAAGVAVETTPVVCRTAVADSPANPLWKTDRNEGTLNYGEWTCDLDTATNKVKNAGVRAWTLVYSHGSQWCPYCYLNGPSFVETATFRQWAKDHNVVLVSADMPHNSDTNPNQDWCTIWHRKAEETNLYFDGKGKVPRSGVGYLSRKMISENEAAAMRAQLKSLNTSFLHLPEDYQTARSIIPGLSLLDATGKVVGRFETFDYNMNNHTDGSLAAVFCQRLSEMLASAESEMPETAVDRESENLNDNCVTTPLTLTMNTAGVAATGTVSHADYRDVYRLCNVYAGMQAVFKVKGVRNDAIRLCLLRGDANGNVTDMIKTVTGNLAKGVAIDTSSVSGFAFDAAGSYFVRVSCRDIMPTTSSNYRPYRLRWGDNEDDATFNGYKADYAGNTLTTYEVSATCLFVPSEVQGEYSAAAGESLTFSVVAGADYRFSGITPPTDNFDLLGGEFYRAKNTECVTMVVGSEPTTVVYQLWRPGTIYFSEGEQRLMERDESGVVTVVRGNGASGVCTVTVRVRSGSEQNVSGRYAFTETNLVWESGESGDKTVAFKLLDNGRFDGEGSFVVELAKGAPCSATVSAVGEKIVIEDTSSPIFKKSHYEVTVYEGFASEQEFETCNVSERGSVKLKTLALSDKLPSGLRLVYDRTSGTALLEGTPRTASAGQYEAAYTITQNRDTGYPTTFSITVKNPQDYNGFVGKKRAAQVISMLESIQGTNYICGTLKVSITAKNKISAKYTDQDMPALTFSGAWSALDETSGVVTAVMEKRGYELMLTMDCAGNLTACLDGGVCGEVPFAQEGIFEAWKGCYTVALPCVGSADNEPCGSGYLTLNMTSASAVKKGLVRFAGMLPNGRNVSGTATLLPSAGKMLLPIYCRAAWGATGIMLAINSDGAAKWNDPENVQVREVLNLAEGYGAYCRLQEQNADRLTIHGGAGSWYSTTTALGEIVRTFYGSSEQVFDVLLVNGVVTNCAGRVVADGKRLTLLEQMLGTTISFVPKTGVFKGRAKIIDATGSLLRGNFAGVLIPGWHKNCDCGDAGIEFPFGAGSFYFTEKVGSARVRRSWPVVFREVK